MKNLLFGKSIQNNKKQRDKRLFMNEKKKKWTTIMEIVLWDFMMFYQIFLSTQVKRSTIITNKEGVYQLPH